VSDPAPLAAAAKSKLRDSPPSRLPDLKPSSVQKTFESL
jgi:hypothetical protein